MQTSYKEPTGVASASIIEKKSEFIAQLSPAHSEEDALTFLEKVRAEHRKANHNVYAYLLQKDNRARYSDDGEPSKTAGYPVLSVIEHSEIVNMIVVVTRYFGGVKLGTGGLVRAYTKAAQAVISCAEIACVRSVVKLCLCIPYSLYDTSHKLLCEYNTRFPNEPVFADFVTINGVLPAEDAPAISLAFTEILRGGDGLSISDPYFDVW